MIRPLLIVGLPRSGTTWIGEILSSQEQTRYLFEPDNEKVNPLAWLCKQEFHRFPYLTADDNAGCYETLWESLLTQRRWQTPLHSFFARYFRLYTAQIEAHIGAKTGFTYVDRMFHGVDYPARRVPFEVKNHRLFAYLLYGYLKRSQRSKSGSGKKMIIKSVHSPLALGWLTSRFNVDVLLVLRNPYSLYASYKRLKMPDGFRNVLFQAGLWEEMSIDLDGVMPDANTTLDIYGLQLAVMLKVLQRQIGEHGSWHIASHDRICLDPLGAFHEIFAQTGLTWSEKTVKAIVARNQEGVGFTADRLAAKQPTKWRNELAQEEIQVLDRWIEQFELGEFLLEYVY